MVPFASNPCNADKFEDPFFTALIVLKLPSGEGSFHA